MRPPKFSSWIRHDQKVDGRPEAAVHRLIMWKTSNRHMPLPSQPPVPAQRSLTVMERRNSRGKAGHHQSDQGLVLYPN
jgi:hypothetical protein